MGLFSRRAPEPQAAVVADIHLNARLQPKHRGSVFEDPLDELLATHAPGSEVVGGGTAFTPETGPQSCDSEVKLVGDPEKTLALVIDILEHLGAPVGSWARIGDGPQRPFGQWHGFALTLDGTGLPDEVYANNDVNDVIGALTAELGENAELQSWWEGPENTALYFYGADAERLRSVLSSAAGRFPLAQNSTVEAITD
jgi:hypothetical protein